MTLARLVSSKNERMVDFIEGYDISERGQPTAEVCARRLA